ncbi:DUF1501 domain-containing protein [Massilia sp. CF038]|uniref:DUF1501 domain-containing protein n=1 Tax=Massilia sp. CF038 TaxID=1881045 RepID=UPI00091BAB48|nr:DUF1501 domain-containing protein [Massilia sp. CF038]SHH08845.1 Uncharacterized conserved protein, DUF1501 family [Massilia sp. CF038]
MQRRTFLHALAAAPLATTGGQLWAAPASGSRLLVVFLRGAYDAASLLVPVSLAALSLDSNWGLHPALRDNIHPLYQNGQVAFIPYAGTDDTSRSHFETQDTIELGQPLGGSRNYRSGFMNRLAATLGGSALSFTEQLPLIMQGQLAIPNTSLRAPAKSALDQRHSEAIAAMYRGTPLATPVNEGFNVRAEVMRDMAGEMEAASRGAIPAKGFEREARRIARLMRDKYHLGFVDVGGWDTHVGQGGSSGYLADRLGELGRGLAAFAQEMESDWDKTVVLVVSEFGRTFRENGNRGTDHGHGSVYWAMGGAVNGGIAGEQQIMSAKNLFQNRDMPVLNEYRAVFGGLFERMYGLNASQLDTVFAGAKARDIGLV